MKKSRGYWARLFFTFAFKAFIAVGVLMLSVGFVEVHNVLRPPRKVSSGSVLKRWKIKQLTC